MADECGHKLLGRLSCERNNPLLCEDLENEKKDCFYDCALCYEADELRQAEWEAKQQSKKIFIKIKQPKRRETL